MLEKCSTLYRVLEEINKREKMNRRGHAKHSRLSPVTRYTVRVVTNLHSGIVVIISTVKPRPYCSSLVGPTVDFVMVRGVCSFSKQYTETRACSYIQRS